MTERNTVTYVRCVECSMSHTKYLWRVVCSDDYVITSSARVPFMFISETAAFWADAAGKVTNYLDLAIVGVPEAHLAVLECAGFNVDRAGIPADFTDKDNL